jgi:hypothetical protein
MYTYFKTKCLNLTSKCWQLNVRTKCIFVFFLVGSGKKLLILTVKVIGTPCVPNNYNIFDLI